MNQVYTYTARSAEGAFIAGALEADNLDHAVSHLRSRSLFVTSLNAADSPRGVITSTLALLPVTESAKVAFFRSFATLVGSGVPLRRALGVTIEQCADRRLAEALRSVASDIEGGSPLSVAMARRPKEFARLFVAMIKAGEIGGALHEVLERIAEFLERDRAIRKRVASALTYPAIVSCTAIGLVLFLIANTVPAFATMFDEMHVSLPLSTRVLIAIAGALKSPVTILALLVSPLVAWMLLRIARKSSRISDSFENAKLSFPIFGSIIRKAAISRFARTLGTLLRSGVALMTALEASQDVAGNVVYRRGGVALNEALRRGDPLTLPLEASGLFEPLFLQLVRVGEETGALDSMLLRLAQYYELDVETAVATLGSVLEPLLILVLGAVVGTIVASILIPLYSVIGSIK
ncbi:MAG: type II secretion system F family protein [Candidatus Baltobacteraceae bacterium]